MGGWEREHERGEVVSDLVQASNLALRPRDLPLICLDFQLREIYLHKTCPISQKL